MVDLLVVTAAGLVLLMFDVTGNALVPELPHTILVTPVTVASGISAPSSGSRPCQFLSFTARGKVDAQIALVE